MKIGIDSRPMYGNPAGIGLYVKNLVENFRKMEGLELVEFGPQKPKILWHLKTYFSIILSKRVDYYLSTHSYLIPSFPFVNSILVVHDLSVCLFPKEYPFKLVILTKLFLKIALVRAKHIIVPSNSTKEDLVKLFKISPRKISVVYHGAKPYGGEITLPKILKDTPFCLFVGTIQPRKNLVFLLKAYSNLIKNLEGKRVKLVICGEKGWKYQEIFETVEKLKLKEMVIFEGYVSESEKFGLYKNAVFLVLPSIYEGFGLPIIEAFCSGCPVVCSNINSLREIGGKAALYFNPRNQRELENQMRKVFGYYFNKNYRYQELIIKGKERSKLFSWGRTAYETFNVIKSIK
jgi:glycosyltransferase involved in cell wall biosynthesis